jgi:uncharacterized phage protein (TIGR02218 family)
MTYESFEESIEGGRPVELYEFVIGTTTYRYTTAEDEISFASQTWFPRQIERTSPEVASDENAKELTFTIPADDPVASQYIDVAPGQKMALTITRFHRGDTEAFILWQGRITGATFTDKGRMATLRGLTVESASSRQIPRDKYQGLCNHVLYDSRCAVTRSSFKYTGTITAVAGNVITVGGLNANGADWALGGYVDFNTGEDARVILAQSGDDLTMLLPFKEDVLGSTVDVYAGCDHSITTCNTKFSNLINYGGFVYVPLINPFQRGLG